MSQVPGGVLVKRAVAFDTGRHLSIRGRYLSWMAYPDRWVSWMLGAIPSGLRLIRKRLALHKLTGLPWVADFRDPMTEGCFGGPDQQPPDPAVWKARRWVERMVVMNSTALGARSSWSTAGSCIRRSATATR
jgi:hypothetical protein